MTMDQNTAVWELRRKGLHELAYQAEQRWEHGQFFERECLPKAAHLLQTLIERCNREVRKMTASK